MKITDRIEIDPRVCNGKPVGENGETDTWLDFAMHCGYLSPEDHGRLTNQCREVGAMLGAMLNDPGPFLIKSR